MMLVFIVVVNLALTAYLLGRVRDYLRRLSVVESKAVSGDVAPAAPAAQGASEDEAKAGALDLQALMAQATPEDVAQAEAILKAMGVKAD